MSGFLRVALAAGFLLLVVAALPATAAAGPGDIGFEGLSYSTTSGDLTGEKPESKLWWNDGSWWASMYHDGSATYRIHRLDVGTQTWVDTGVVLDNRPNATIPTRADTLWDGTRLYVASHRWAPSGSATGQPTRLYRFSYNTATDTYSLDSGFPVNINNVRSEALTIAKDSTGQLWATWTQTVGGQRQVFVNRTTGSDTSWGTPFRLPASPIVAADDISAVVAFGDNKIGVMWSNQINDNMSFAVHDDSAADMTWPAPVAAFSGNNNADDHINLKATADGRVFAAVKTSQSTGTATLLTLLVRSASGTWSNHAFSRKSENMTRPIVVIDEPGGVVHVFMTREGGGTAYEKTAPLNSISFPTGLGTVVMKDTDSGQDDINNVTSTKQNVSGATDLVVAATNATTKRYWHHYDPLGGPPPNTAPTAIAGSSSTTVDTPVTITLRGTDAQQCELNFAIASGPSNGALGPIGNAVCAAGSPNSDTATVAYTPSSGYTGPDSFTFTVNDGTLTSTPATVSITVNAVPTNTAPTAVGGSASTTEDTPVTITLSGTDAEQCELNFTIASGPSNGTLGSIGNTVCTAGSPNSDTATVVYTPSTGYTGPDSFTFTVNDGSLTSTPATVSITVNPAPDPGEGISFVGVSSAANPTATTLTINAPTGVAAGNVLLAAIHVRGQPAITPPTGWVLVRQEQNGSNMRAAVYYKVAASEPTSYTWTFASSQAAAGGITAWAGVSTTTPIDAHGGQVNASSTTITAPSITTTTANTMLVGFFGIGPATTLTPPGGMTERWDVASTQGSFKATSGAASALQAAVGPTGTRAATSANASTNIGQLVALRPA